MTTDTPTELKLSREERLQKLYTFIGEQMVNAAAMRKRTEAITPVPEGVVIGDPELGMYVQPEGDTLGPLATATVFTAQRARRMEVRNRNGDLLPHIAHPTAIKLLLQRLDDMSHLQPLLQRGVELQSDLEE